MNGRPGLLLKGTAEWSFVKKMCGFVVAELVSSPAAPTVYICLTAEFFFISHRDKWRMLH